MSRRLIPAALIGLAASAALVLSTIPAQASGPWFGSIQPPIIASASSAKAFVAGTDRYDKGLIFGNDSTGTFTTLAPAANGGSLAGKTVVAMSMEENGICALDNDGGLHCWGDSKGFDRFAQGNTDDQPLPVRIPILIDGVDVAVHDMVVADEMICALAATKAVCFGNKPYVLPGITATPSVIEGLPPAIQITGDFGSACAITIDLEVWCWGGARELGVGQTSGYVEPTKLAGSLVGRQVVDIEMGDDVTCAIDTGGRVHCWGEGGRSGMGTGPGPDGQEPVQIGGSLRGQRIVGLAVGSNWGYAIDQRGRMHSWGGESIPALTDDLGPLAGKRIVQVSTDSRRDVRHTCALTDIGDVYCWGFNGYGRLGIGGDEDMYGITYTPAKMLPGAAKGMKITQVEVGQEYTFVIAGRPLFTPTKLRQLSGSATFDLFELSSRWGAKSIGVLPGAKMSNDEITMKVTQVSSRFVRLAGGITITTSDGITRVLSDPLVEKKSGKVSFRVEGIGSPYAGNRITMFIADITDRVEVVKDKKLKTTQTTVTAAPVRIGPVADFPGDIWFPGDAFDPGDIWFPGDAFDPGGEGSPGTMYLSWSEQRR